MEGSIFNVKGLQIFVVATMWILTTEATGGRFRTLLSLKIIIYREKYKAKRVNVNVPWQKIQEEMD